MVPLRFSGMLTSERKMFWNNIQASPTYSILTRRLSWNLCYQNNVSIKQVQLTQFWRILLVMRFPFWISFNQASSTYSILTPSQKTGTKTWWSVSIKQVRLTQFWHRKKDRETPFRQHSFNQASSTYSILTYYHDYCIHHHIMFQSSKFDLLNSDSSLWRARRGAPSEGRFAKPQKSEKFLQKFCINFIQSNFKNYKKSSKYSCKINRLQR